jgi:thiamine-phosphate pyrophosphorylase
MLPRLHVLTDTHLQARYSHLQLGQAAAQAGRVLVQFREKAWNPQQHGEQLRALIAQLDPARNPVLVNDRVDLALEYGSAGVHVGITDTPPSEARKRLHPGSIVGATVHNQAELEALAGLEIDYIGVGPVLGTRSKDTGLPPLGFAGLAALARQSPWPVIAIGSLQPAHVPALRDAGVYGLAVLSGFCCADSPQHAAQDYLQALAAAGLEP